MSPEEQEKLLAKIREEIEQQPKVQATEPGSAANLLA